MKYLLDSNVCIQHLRGNVRVQRRIDAEPEVNLVVTSIVWSELLYGAIRSRQPREADARVRAFLARFKSLPFDNAAAEHLARIRDRLALQRGLIGPYDLQIAAIATAHNLIVVTNNTGEFSRIDGLPLEDWQKG